MKNSAAIALSGFASLSMAAICNNNCGRQVFGTAAARGPVPTLQAQRSSACSDFLTTYVTTTPSATVTAAPIYNRNVHNRAAGAPDLVSHKPAWATACTADLDYYNACQCFGITPTIITVAAPTTVTATLPGPTCIQGVEYALYTLTGDKAAQLHIPNDADNIDLLDPSSLLSGLTPVQTGSVAAIGASAPEGNPISLAGGQTGTAGSTSTDNVVVYRGYIVPATAGDYTFSVTALDDMVVVWTGDAAASEDMSEKLIGSTWGKFNYQGFKPATGVVSVAEGGVGKAVPFKIFYSNNQAGGAFEASVTDPAGNVILGGGSGKNQEVVSGCQNGGPAGEWPAWVSGPVAS